MRPFLKWAGGKYRLVSRIRARLPAGERLIEPFVGSAAVWLNTAYPMALLADANPDLIGCYQQLQRHGEAFIAACRAYFVPDNNRPERYYALRERFNAVRDPWERAVLFVYLNRHGYNGLCRYNAAGAFNVPFGRYRRPYFPEAEMRAFWRKAQGVTFRCADFREVLAEARPGDVVYCDPPYVPLSATANFTDYSAGGFGPQDQADLADWAERLAARGIPVLISNHATPFTEEAYHSAQVERFGVQRFISCDGDHRGVADEVLALFEGHGR
ncbi:MAG: Dam family site-specific DNA-(adenine-N6)-methyltransferase [Firmicutes bacterium]|nr:Dam family site-specific DNA-(adenine-N6)-methyltransferase [Alicyclobacillaceae bacterium]MCL6497334.1 Dam family site-specific DNA-(adenine-N6)-methyltransferase [Bacillota bacterium]